MYGGPGLMDHRAALLASRGFTVFALPIYAYEDLPSTMPDVSLDYLIVGLFYMYVSNINNTLQCLTYCINVHFKLNCTGFNCFDVKKRIQCRRTRRAAPLEIC